MDTKTKRTGMNIGLMALMGLVGILAVGTMSASASGPLQNMTQGVATNLGISQDNAGLLLSVSILISITLCVAIIGGKKMSPIVMFVPNIAAMAFLVAIAWLPWWVLMVVAILIAYPFATSLRDTLTGG